MGFEMRMLPLGIGLAISGITFYYFMEKQKTRRQSIDSVSSKKLEVSVIEATSHASNVDIESPTKYEPVEQVETPVFYAQETQAENVPLIKCAEATEIKPLLVEATVGTTLGAALKSPNNNQVKKMTIYNQESQEKVLFQQVSIIPQRMVSFKSIFWLLIAILFVLAIQIIIFL